MNQLPGVIVYIHDGCLTIDLPNDLVFVGPLLQQELNIMIGVKIDSKIKTMAKLAINNVFIKWIEEGFIYKTNNKWKVNIVGLISKELGYYIERFKPIYEGLSKSCYSKEILAECLIDRDGNLCNQLKTTSGELIEWFGKCLDAEVLNNAIQEYKNEMILDIANIKIRKEI